MVVSLPVHNNTTNGRVNRQSVLCLTTFFERFDLRRADIPEQQPLTRRFKQIVGTAGDPWKRAVFQQRVGFQSKQILLLRCDQVWTIDRKQWFTRYDGFADVIDEHFFNEPRDFGVDVCDFGFVIGDSADRAHFLCEPQCEAARSYF